MSHQYCLTKLKEREFYHEACARVICSLQGLSDTLKQEVLDGVEIALLELRKERFQLVLGDLPLGATKMTFSRIFHARVEDGDGPIRARVFRILG